MADEHLQHPESEELDHEPFPEPPESGPEPGDEQPVELTIGEEKDETVEPRDRLQLFIRNLDWKLIGMILVIKALLFIFAAQSFQILDNKKAEGLYGALEIWNRWDSLNYIRLAQYGYSGEGQLRPLLVFYPLFPWVIRFFTFFTGNYLVSAIFISTIASIAAGLLLKNVILLDHSEETANRAVWFLFIFPTSYFLHIGYTESLFLTLALGGFLAARKDRWWLAGVLGALACLTRGTGLVLLPALAAEAIQDFRVRRRWNWGWLWIAVVPLGFGIYLLVNRHAAGDPFAFIGIRRQFFYISSSLPWVGITDTFRSMKYRTPAEAELIGTQELLFMTLGLVCAIVSAIKLRVSYGVWIAGNWLLVTSVTFIASVPRYTLVMFPIYILFAKLARRSLWNVAITVWSLLYLSLFAAEFVRGRWAF
jgi:hypothetical protein